jgi:hypothetical protein
MLKALYSSKDGLYPSSPSSSFPLAVRRAVAEMTFKTSMAISVHMTPPTGATIPISEQDRNVSDGGGTGKI